MPRDPTALLPRSKQRGYPDTAPPDALVPPRKRGGYQDTPHHERVGCTLAALAR